MAAIIRSCDIAGLTKVNCPTSVARQRFDKARLGGWEQLREHAEIVAAGGANPQHCVHLDADHVAVRRKPQLTLAGKQHLPSFMLLPADQGVLAVGAGPPVGSRFASGAGQVVVAAGSAVLGPSAGLKVPEAEGPNPFFAALSSTWRSVNSWKKRSPTG
jgi:hypothetical protein